MRTSDWPVHTAHSRFIHSSYVDIDECRFTCRWLWRPSAIWQPGTARPVCRAGAGISTCVAGTYSRNSHLFSPPPTAVATWNGERTEDCFEIHFLKKQVKGVMNMCTLMEHSNLCEQSFKSNAGVIRSSSGSSFVFILWTKEETKGTFFFFKEQRHMRRPMSCNVWCLYDTLYIKQVQINLLREHYMDGVFLFGFQCSPPLSRLISFSVIFVFVTFCHITFHLAGAFIQSDLQSCCFHTPSTQLQGAIQS